MDAVWRVESTSSTWCDRDVIMMMMHDDNQQQRRMTCDSARGSVLSQQQQRPSLMMMVWPLLLQDCLSLAASSPTYPFFEHAPPRSAY